MVAGYILNLSKMLGMEARVIKKKHIVKKKALLIPIRPLTNYDLLYYAKQLEIPHFRGVFCIDTLPKKPLKNERSIVNLDTSSGPGSHWITYVFNTTYTRVIYYDPFGNLKPPP